LVFVPAKVFKSEDLLILIEEDNALIEEMKAQYENFDKKKLK